MPLHRLYVPPKLYSAEEKSAIAEAITKVYSNLPAFYVVVLFISVDKEDYYVGGRRSDNFVRISVEHIARQFAE
jgi:phenylpyruvate tautomerase PptA (4-oxalocrotonate tautomerase family)